MIEMIQPVLLLAASVEKLDFSKKGPILIEAFQYHLNIFKSFEKQAAKVIP